MVYEGESPPFFQSVQHDFKIITDTPDLAKNDLITRNPVFYKKTMFRAFLHYGREEVEFMTLQEYMDACIMLDEVLKIIHAPYIKGDD